MHYQNVLCLNPYLRESSAAMGFFPPTGLEYVATAMKDDVGNVVLMDLRRETEYRDPERLCQFIKDHIDLVCVSVNWSYFFDEVCDLVRRLPASVPVIVGGQQATDHVEELFERCPNIDIIVRGEGEETIREIVQNRPREQILGISFRKDGQTIHNPNRPLAPTDSLRYPDRRLRRASYYVHYKNVPLLRGGFDTVLSARGCPYNCKFCTFTLNPLGQKRPYSMRSVESVVEEIKGLEADLIFFADDNFFADPERSERLCDRLLAEGIRKKYIVQTRLEVYRHPQMLRKAEQAGFKVFLIGIESPHDRILKQLNKGFTTEVVRRAFEELRKYSFYYHGYFIYGNIGETREEMLHIATFARQIGLHSISFQRLQARKFSPLKDLVEKTPGYYLSANGSVYSEQFGRKEMIRIRRQIGRRFYTLPQLIRIGRKLDKLDLYTAGDLLALLLRLPILGYQALMRRAEKWRTRRARKARQARRALAESAAMPRTEI